VEFDERGQHVGARQAGPAHRAAQLQMVPPAQGDADRSTIFDPESRAKERGPPDPWSWHVFIVSRNGVPHGTTRGNCLLHGTH
jgi:hypothetical protein